MKFTTPPNFAVHAVSAVCRQDQYFLLIKRAKPSFQNWLAFPGGKIERGETPVQALRRELKEETNLSASEFRHLTTIDLVDAPSKRRSYFLSVYEAFDVKGEAMPGDDAAEIHWLTLTQMRKQRTIPSVLEIAEKLLSEDHDADERHLL